jgi:hypothetical protein
MSKAKSSTAGITTQNIILFGIGLAVVSLLFYLFFSAPTELIPPEKVQSAAGSHSGRNKPASPKPEATTKATPAIPTTKPNSTSGTNGSKPKPNTPDKKAAKPAKPPATPVSTDPAATPPTGDTPATSSDPAATAPAAPANPESAPAPEYRRPVWYRVGTYILQTLSIAYTGWLCWRNCQSPKMLGGRNVWLGLGMGVVSWGFGNLIFGYLDLSTGKPPEPPAIPDFFFVVTYLLLSWGMALSVIGKRLNLFPKQWGIVGSVGLFGLIFGIYVTFFAGVKDGAIELGVGKLLAAFYALGDVWLLIVATILLLAYWGGKAAQSWRLLGGAGISMFIADLGYNYSLNSSGDKYQSGDWIEFFWILAFVLWGMGAALEFDLSAQRSSSSRRRSRNTMVDE